MDLELTGQRIEKICFDYAVTLVTDSSASIRIGTSFSLDHSDRGPVDIRIEDGHDELEATLVLLRDEIDSANVLDSGELTLHFSDSAVVRVGPDREFEAWEFNGPDRRRVICMPGGELATWAGV